MLFVNKQHENKNEKKTSIYDDISDVCKKLEYLVKTDVSGNCCTDDFSFNGKIADEHMKAVLELTDKIKEGNEENKDYAALVAGDIITFYNGYKTHRLNADILMHAKLARLELAIMAEMKTFKLEEQREMQEELAQKEKNNINKIMGFLAETPGQEKVFETYSIYSDAISSYIKTLSQQKSAGVENKTDNTDMYGNECQSSVLDSNSIYKAAEEISILSEKIKGLDFELEIKKKNEEKLQALLDKKNEEISLLQKKAAQAEAEKALLFTDIESVKREALAKGRLKINFPLISVSHRISEETWEQQKPNIFQKILNMLPKSDKRISTGTNKDINIDAYECQIVNSADNLICLGDSPFVSGYALYRDMGGRHYFAVKTIGKSIKNGKIMDIHIGETDEKLLIHKFADSEFLSYCNEHPNLCEVLPDFYSFMKSVMKVCMWEGNADTSDIVNFNIYYMHLIVLIKDFVRQNTKLCAKAAALANELLILYKCCGAFMGDEAAFIQKISDYLICNDKAMIKVPDSVKSIMSASSEASAYLDELMSAIVEFPKGNAGIAEIEEKVCPVDTQEKQVIDTQQKLQNESEAITKQIPVRVKEQGSINKYKRAMLPDMKNIRFIVSKTSAGGGEDISTYAVENIDSAVGQYCFVECPYKKIGVAIGEKQYFILASESGSSSKLLLTQRDKKFICEEGLLDIIEYYEYRLLTTVEMAEMED